MKFKKEISKLLQEQVRKKLTKYSKIATKRTYNSIKGFDEQKGNVITVGTTADEGLFFIEKGKRANTKLPVYKSGNKFKLFKRILDWKQAVNFKGSDFLLARAIAKNARKGIPISREVIDENSNIMLSMAYNGILDEQLGEVATYFNKIYTESNNRV